MNQNAGQGPSDRFVDLLRHGEVVGGGRFRGDTDDLLSPAGLAQMRTATQGLQSWDALISSPARRCAAFASELAPERGLPLQHMPEFGERCFGAWENRTAEEIPLVELQRFWDDPIGFTPPGAEPFEALRERVLHGWDRLLAGDARFPLLITHGGVIRIILGAALDMPAAALLRIEVPPACLSRLRVPSGAGRPSLMFHRGPDLCGAPS